MSDIDFDLHATKRNDSSHDAIISCRCQSLFVVNCNCFSEGDGFVWYCDLLVTRHPCLLGGGWYFHSPRTLPSRILLFNGSFPKVDFERLEIFNRLIILWVRHPRFWFLFSPETQKWKVDMHHVNVCVCFFFFFFWE